MILFSYGDKSLGSSVFLWERFVTKALFLQSRFVSVEQ